ncbi:hypothetical protein YC2023_108509 [Brassica napus]
MLNTAPGSRRTVQKLEEVRVQISLSRPVSFFMVKPRFCPNQDQSTPVQSSRPWGFGQVLSDQPAASRLEHWVISAPRPRTQRVQGNPLFAESGRLRRMVLALRPKSGLGTGLGLVLALRPKSDCLFLLLEVRSWQEAKSNSVTVCLALAFIAC